jgi:uncharacterized membrane protein
MSPSGGTATQARIRAIDWLRGLVMMLMTIDHAGHAYDAHHYMTDGAMMWTPGSAIPTGEFVTRWVTHLCAPAFVLLAGTSLALSTEKRRSSPGQTAFIVKRGLLIAVLDPLWMSLAITLWHPILLQVLYAIGLSLACMAFLRKLSTRALLGLALAIQIFGELSSHAHFASQPMHAIWALLLTGGLAMPNVLVGYPFIPWLSIMMAGWVLGRWIIETREQSNASRVPTLALIGVALLVVFVVVRALDGYGNWGLYRDSLMPLQWIHVAKYPPSIAYSSLELGIAFLLLALFFKLDDGSPRPAFAAFALFGSTAFFYYLLHFHLLGGVSLLLRLDPQQHGLVKTYVSTVLVLLVLAPACIAYRRYKRAHPDGWTRYI